MQQDLFSPYSEYYAVLFHGYISCIIVIMNKGIEMNRLYFYIGSDENLCRNCSMFYKCLGLCLLCGLPIVVIDHF